MTSAAKPIARPALALTETAPRPSAAGSLPDRMMSVRPAPMNAPDELGADVADRRRRMSILRVASRAIVTAGLMWQPLMWPTE